MSSRALASFLNSPSHFQVELQTVQRVTVSEELVPGKGGRGEAHTSRGDIEDISMPMSSDKLRGNSTPKRVILGNGIQRHLEKANLTLTRLNSSAKG
jgi:hypothetical protein